MKSLNYCSNQKKLLQRTNSFDDANHCNCNCSDWLLDLEHIDDPFGSVQDEVLKVNGSSGGEAADSTADTMDQLATIFTPTIHSIESQLTNGFSTDTTRTLNSTLNNDLLFCDDTTVPFASIDSFNQINGFQSNNRMSRIVANVNNININSTLKPFATLNGRMHCRKVDCKSDNGIDVRVHKFSTSTSSGSSSSSSNNTGCCSNSSTGSCCCSSNRSFRHQRESQSAHHHHQHGPQNQLNGHLSAHSTSVNLNNNCLMDSSKCDETNHLQISSTKEETNKTVQNDNGVNTSTESTASNISVGSKVETVDNTFDLSDTFKLTNSDTNTVTGYNNNINSNNNNNNNSNSSNNNINVNTTKPPIIDLLKEFDVCFNSNDNIDDDSSTLTDNSSVRKRFYILLL